MSEGLSWREAYERRSKEEIGRALSRRIVRAMYQKLRETHNNKGIIWSANFQTSGDYDRLTLIVIPGEPDMINHAIRWDSENGSWQRGGGIDYEFIAGTDQLKINRASMSLIEEIQTIEQQRRDIDQAMIAEEFGLTKVDRQEAKGLLQTISSAKELIY